MDFEEKIDAMRMTLELATHDIEALRVSIRELHEVSANLREAYASQYIKTMLKC
jgi:hypothetical protein